MPKSKTMSSTEFNRIRKALDAKARPFRMFGTKRKSGPGRPPAEHVTQHALARSLRVNKRTIERYEAGELEIPSDVAERMRELASAYGRKVA